MVDSLSATSIYANKNEVNNKIFNIMMNALIPAKKRFSELKMIQQMNKILITIFLFTVSPLYSQADKIEKQVRYNNEDPFFMNESGIDMNGFENNLSHNVEVSDLDSSSLVDSVIYIRDNGDRKKRTYLYELSLNKIIYFDENWDGSQWENSELRYTQTFDSNGNRTLFLIEGLESNNWVILMRYTYTYDSNGNQILELGEYRDESIDNRRVTYTYDSNGNMILETRKNWDGINWVDNYQNIYTFDSDGNKISYLSVGFLNDHWINIEKSSYTYDLDGNMISYLHEDWGNSQWQKRKRENYTYDSNGNMNLKLVEVWEEDQWVNDFRFAYIYDTSGNLISLSNEDWKENEWFAYHRETFSYDSNGYLISVIYEHNYGSQWKNQTRETYTYNSEGNMTSHLEEGTDSSGWVNYYLRTYSYNSKGDMTLGLSKRWNGSSWTFLDNNLSFTDSFGRAYNFGASEIKIYYSLITDVEESHYILSKYVLEQNYPNPYNPRTTITYLIPEQSQVELKVFDVLGREITELVNEEQSSGKYEIQFNAGSLSSGIYFYRIKAGNFIESKKMLLVK